MDLIPALRRMKNTLFVLLFSVLALVAGAANPSFESFNTNQFSTTGNKVAIRPGAKLTNVVMSGTPNIGDVWTATNNLGGGYWASAVNPTNGQTAIQVTNIVMGIAAFTNTLYVAPWANDATATRGNIGLPFTLSNALAQVRSYERIAVMGSNFVAVRVPLPIGQSYVETNVIAAPLLLSNRTGVTIQGLAGGGIFWTNYGTVLTIYRATNCVIDNLVWNGTVKNPISTNGLASVITILNDSDGLVFRGNTFLNFAPQGIYALNALRGGRSHVRNVWVVQNYFQNIGDYTLATAGDGTPVVPAGDNWIVSQNIFDGVLRMIEPYAPADSHGVQYGHIYSDNIGTNIAGAGIFQLNDGSRSNIIVGLKIHGNTIAMSKQQVGSISVQTGGIELRGPLRDVSISGNTIEGTNSLMSFGVFVGTSDGSVDGVSVADNNVRGASLRGIQVTRTSGSTNTMRNARISGNSIEYVGNGMLVGGENMAVLGNVIGSYGDYSIYLLGPSSGVQVMGNILSGGGLGAVVEATVTNAVFQQNFDRANYATTANAATTIADSGVGTLVDRTWLYNNLTVRGTNVSGYSETAFISTINDLRAAAAYLTNVSIYNAATLRASKDAGSNNRFLELSNTANANVRWDAVMNSAGWRSWYQPVYGNYGLIEHTNGNVSLGDFNASTFTNNGTIITTTLRAGDLQLSSPSTQGYVLAVQGDGVTVKPTNSIGGSSSSPASNNVSLVYISTNTAPSISNPTNLFFDPRSDVRFRMFNPESELGKVKMEFLYGNIVNVTATNRVAPFLTLTNTGADSVNNAHLIGTFRSPYVFVKARVLIASTNSSTPNSYLSIGLRDTNTAEHIWSVINFADNLGGYLSAVTNRPGGAAAVNSSTAAITGLTRSNIWVGFMMAGQQAGLFVDVGLGWTQIQNYDYKDVLDMMQSTNVARMIPSIEWYSGQNNYITITDFSASYSGPIGLADGTWISFEDGSPLVRDGRYYVALSSRNLRTSDYVSEYRASHQSIWSCDLNLENWREQAKIFYWRSNQIYADYDSHFVFDRTTGLWHYTANTWPTWFGNGTPVTIMVGTTDRDLLNGVQVVRGSQPITITANTNNIWDGWMFKTNGLWNLFYTRTATNMDGSTFGPVLARSASASITGTFTNAASYIPSEGGQRIEGINGFRAGGVTYVDSATTTNTVLFFDTALNLVGILPMTVDSGGTPAPAHAAILPLQGDGFTQWKMLTFDLVVPPGGSGAGAYGTLLTRTATNVLSGYEWPIRLRPAE